ncbi:transcriptional regulator [Allokutzneria sp. A3M-2-11 16]|uniref:transcriptional regulator n=1 Tax=Allokutzneria sp. A3M-2-11 16 TaxID=2962043 RepID=UPI0020B74E47|nr:transcriptional regulator [Allokutzneria sp. A3M-2-11 16]MCP3803463.1 transcriptional regulator [Allokutzneria sp. A3M-2-11 16]
MSLANGWTGETACALQKALRLSNETFAERLGIGSRTVAAWHQKPSLRPKSEMQQLLDTALEQASASVQERFAELTQDSPAQVPEGAAADAERRLSSDPNMAAALDWLDEKARWEPGTARREVAARLAQLDVRDLHDRGVRRGRVDQRRIAQALGDYYCGTRESHGRYGAHFGSDTDVTTSVLTHPDWLDLDCPLTAKHDRLRLTSTTPQSGLSLNDETARQAAQRLAETLALGIRLVDTPLYRLLHIGVGKQLVAGSVGVTRFVEYAVTMDLLEGELIDALSSGASTQPGSLPLRDRYLPNLASVLGVSGRLCSGGALALTAIARPARAFHGEADYLLLVQERSGSVLNAARRLAVIPKGFHEPLNDLRAGAQLGATLRREMEEELFGRDDIDSTLGDQRHADPMHPSRLSEPMRWLMEEPGRLRMECTGFGLNLVSGNFEFAGLVVIDDEEFWNRFGGQVKANWESSMLHQYSSLDADLLEELVGDVAWSNEGLFAFLQGLRRLREIGGHRVNLPEIEWEIR